MRPVLSRWIGPAATAALLVSCQENREPTLPELARVKPDRVLTVTGGGTGSGRVTAPQVFEVPALVCGVERGRYDPTECAKSYPWKSTVTLTAEADPGSNFMGWSGACTGTAPTCKLTLTQNRSVKATFGGGGLPSFVLNVVGQGTGSGTVRSEANPTPVINCTISAGSATGSACSASLVNGTAITLSATALTGHTFSGWSGACSGSGACSITMLDNRSVTARFTAPAGPEATVGRWDAPAPTPVVGVHLNLLRDGRLLLWGHAGQPYTWNPGGGGFAQVANGTCAGTTCELFCAGHTFLADGRLLVAGGHNEEFGDGHGLQQASIFDGTTWQGTGRMKYGRWYPSLVTLPNGDVVAISGTQQPGLSAPTPERWNGSTWTELTGANSSLSLYPRTFVEPKNGWVFLAGDGNSTYLDPSGSGRYTNAGLGNAGNRVVGNRDYGSAVMWDSKVLYIGGGGASTGTNCVQPQNTAEIIDLAAGTPTWSLVAPMSFRRRQTNATILPTGDVLVTGGSGTCGFTNETGAVFAAELYNPVTNSWSTMANAAVVRVYHSTATLLPDGRVLVTGSGDGGGVTQQLTYEFFSPPYLFKGPRPTFTAPDTMRYGQSFMVTSPQASTIAKATIIRLVSTTHAFDMGQRLNTLSFPAPTDGASLSIVPPTTTKVAPPGPYMLFLVDQNGVPSVAKTVLLAP
jgi:hypothetical protein